MNKFNPKIHHRKSIRLKGYDYSRAGLYFITICCQNRECLFGEIVGGEMVLNNAGVMINQIWHEIPNDFQNIKLHEMVIMPNHIHTIIQITPVGADTLSAQKFAQNNGENRADMESAQKFAQNNGENRADMESAPKSAQNNGENGADMESAPKFAQNNDENRADMESAQKTAQNNDENRADMESAQKFAQNNDENRADMESAPKFAQNNGENRADMESAPTTIPMVVQSFKRHTTIKYIKMVKNGVLPPFDKRIWQRNYWEHIVRNENEYRRIALYIIDNPQKWSQDKLNGGKGNQVMEQMVEYNHEVWMV